MLPTVLVSLCTHDCLDIHPQQAALRHVVSCWQAMLSMHRTLLVMSFTCCERSVSKIVLLFWCSTARASPAILLAGLQIDDLTVDCVGLLRSGFA